MKRLAHSNIEYAVNPDGSQGYGWNFYPGCLHKPEGKCPVPHCWAESMSKRHLQDFHKPHLIPELLLAPLHIKKPSTILVNFMGDLMGSWVNPDEMVNVPLVPGLFQAEGLKYQVMRVIKQCPQHRFLFLTKNPEGYKRWGDFPGNAWLGASVWNEETMIKALYALTEVKAGGRWLSVEPMLAPVVPKVWPAEWDDIGWVVIGAQARPAVMPKLEWVEEIVTACEKAKIPIWLKENLYPLFKHPEIETGYAVPKWARSNHGINVLRQEFPK